MAETVPVAVSNARLQEIGQDLGNWLGTMRSLHIALAGGPLVGSPTPIEGSLRSELIIPEFAEVTITPAYQKQYQRLELVGGVALEASAASEGGQFFTETHRLEGVRSFKSKGTTDDHGRLTGMRVEGINPDPRPDGNPNAAEAIVIPGNELLLASFLVNLRENG